MSDKQNQRMKYKKGTITDDDATVTKADACCSSAELN